MHTPLAETVAGEIRAAAHARTLGCPATSDHAAFEQDAHAAASGTRAFHMSFGYGPSAPTERTSAGTRYIASAISVSSA